MCERNWHAKTKRLYCSNWKHVWVTIGLHFDRFCELCIIFVENKVLKSCSIFDRLIQILNGLSYTNGLFNCQVLLNRFIEKLKWIGFTKTLIWIYFLCDWFCKLRWVIEQLENWVSGKNKFVSFFFFFLSGMFYKNQVLWLSVLRNCTDNQTAFKHHPFTGFCPLHVSRDELMMDI